VPGAAEPSVTVAAFAPAKVNLYLHVLGRRADGYHLVDSLIGFVDVGDRITARPAAALSLALDGPEASALAPAGDDNLMLRAARLLAEHTGNGAGAALGLHKTLPVAAGIGGGSSDAAATLRALRRLWNVAIDDAGLARLGAGLGADVPVCIFGRAAWVGGIGERIAPAPDLPTAGIVLANPRIALPTATVFAARSGRFCDSGRFAAMPRDAAGLAALLQHRSNDLTEAAIGLVPPIGDVLEALSRLPGALLARMSGSGATCFALFASRDMAERARIALAAAEPQWWCAAGELVAGELVAGEPVSR
jgi:4-diphosphocytidyl-2-C-methyl-D-erythritol kinase